MSFLKNFWNWITGKPTPSKESSIDAPYPRHPKAPDMQAFPIRRTARPAPQTKPLPYRSAPDLGNSYPRSANRSTVAPATPSFSSPSDNYPDLVTTAILYSALSPSSDSYSSSSSSDSYSSSSYDSSSSSSSCD